MNDDNQVRIQHLILAVLLIAIIIALSVQEST